MVIFDLRYDFFFLPLCIFHTVTIYCSIWMLNQDESLLFCECEHNNSFYSFVAPDMIQWFTTWASLDMRPNACVYTF